MMEIRISLNEYADIPFIKKLLSQIKGVSDIELIKDNEMLSDKENEEIKDLLLEKSLEQSKNGEKVKYSKEILDETFK
ncbi:hypothetical protein GCM10010992_15450 [Cloacibacterium rupense]|uniref:Uncharacterized protein n=2 Tax=Cloacibacterium rupense TaxID=517423 RepID=A0ABQ2NIF8_9FLAO|nr:hypothetical protein GCM10010992_15450 [Cloacibacterium rupense]